MFLSSAQHDDGLACPSTPPTADVAGGAAAAAAATPWSIYYSPRAITPGASLPADVPVWEHTVRALPAAGMRRSPQHGDGFDDSPVAALIQHTSAASAAGNTAAMQRAMAQLSSQLMGLAADWRQTLEPAASSSYSGGGSASGHAECADAECIAASSASVPAGHQDGGEARLHGEQASGGGDQSATTPAGEQWAMPEDVRSSHDTFDHAPLPGAVANSGSRDQRPASGRAQAPKQGRKAESASPGKWQVERRGDQQGDGPAQQLPLAGDSAACSPCRDLSLAY